LSEPPFSLNIGLTSEILSDIPLRAETLCDNLLAFFADCLNDIPLASLLAMDSMKREPRKRPSTPKQFPPTTRPSSRTVIRRVPSLPQERFGFIGEIFTKS